MHNYDQVDDSTPVLVGQGQITDRDKGLDPLQLMAAAGRRALADCGVPELAGAIDTVAVVRLIVDGAGMEGRPHFRTFTNPPRTLAASLGAQPVTEIYGCSGGNSPQQLVNHLAQRITLGETQVALLAGAEALATLVAGLKRGEKITWGDNPGGSPEIFGEEKPGTREIESRHRLDQPVEIYPLFAHGLRRKYGQSIAEHLTAVGELFAPFTGVAALNPLAWFPRQREARELTDTGADNRWVGHPYPKLVNAIIRVNQGAALLLCSAGAARRLGIAPSHWVFLHGCGEANDLYYITDRVDYENSYALQRMTARALEMAGKSVADLDFFDLYSCFPCAVQCACDALGIAHDDPRGLTLTGGLPYFGGPGNNYVMHAIAEAMIRARSRPGNFALVTGNGWYLTKHSCGIYSTEPREGTWRWSDPAPDQRELDAMARPVFAPRAEGNARVETYTVHHDREGPTACSIVGRLDDGRRFVALTPANRPEILRGMVAEDRLDQPGRVATDAEGRNIFTPAFAH